MDCATVLKLDDGMKVNTISGTVKSYGDPKSGVSEKTGKAWSFIPFTINDGTSDLDIIWWRPKWGEITNLDEIAQSLHGQNIVIQGTDKDSPRVEHNEYQGETTIRLSIGGSMVKPPGGGTSVMSASPHGPDQPGLVGMSSIPPLTATCSDLSVLAQVSQWTGVLSATLPQDQIGRVLAVMVQGMISGAMTTTVVTVSGEERVPT
jgi:hypothetical protein